MSCARRYSCNDRPDSAARAASSSRALSGTLRMVMEVPMLLFCCHRLHNAKSAFDVAGTRPVVAAAVESRGSTPSRQRTLTLSLRGYAAPFTRRSRVRDAREDTLHHGELARPVAADLREVVGDVAQPAMIEDVEGQRRQRPLIREELRRHERELDERGKPQNSTTGALQDRQ